MKRTASMTMREMAQGSRVVVVTVPQEHVEPIELHRKVGVWEGQERLHEDEQHAQNPAVPSAHPGHTEENN
jgi:hypothetical protein